MSPSVQPASRYRHGGHAPHRRRTRQPGGSGNALAGMTMPSTQVKGCCSARRGSGARARGPARFRGWADAASVPGGAGPDVVVRPGTRPCSSGVSLGQGTSRQRAPPMPLRLAQLGVFPTCWLVTAAAPGQPSPRSNQGPALPAAAHHRPPHPRPTQTQNPHPQHLTPGTTTS